jgi:hypothetical protein
VGDKDKSEVQRERVRCLFDGQFPCLVIEFRPAGAEKTSEFRFRIIEKGSGRIVASIPERGKWAADEVADWDDDKILSKIRQLLEFAPTSGLSM